eukprot:754112-Heterocapsa_arctica.AAC.1
MNLASDLDAGLSNPMCNANPLMVDVNVPPVADSKNYGRPRPWTAASGTAGCSEGEGEDAEAASP